jgi:hypothetical protein
MADDILRERNADGAHVVPKPRKLTVRQTEKLIAHEVERLYGQHCRGQINVRDLTKVFAAGTSAMWAAARQQSAQGTVPFDIEAARTSAAAAMIETFEQVRVKP